MNTQLAFLPSATRTAGDIPLDINNTEDYQSAIIVVDVTAYPAAASVTLILQGKDLLSGKYWNILVSAGITSTGTTVFHVNDGTEPLTNISIRTRLPRVWRLFFLHDDTDSITYSVGVDLSTGPMRRKNT